MADDTEDDEEPFDERSPIFGGQRVSKGWRRERRHPPAYQEE